MGPWTPDPWCASSHWMGLGSPWSHEVSFPIVLGLELDDLEDPFHCKIFYDFKYNLYNSYYIEHM